MFSVPYSIKMSTLVTLLSGLSNVAIVIDENGNYFVLREQSTL